MQICVKVLNIFNGAVLEVISNFHYQIWFDTNMLDMSNKAISSHVSI